MFQGTTLTPLLSIEHSSLSIDPLPFVKKAAAVARKPNSVPASALALRLGLRRDDDHSSSPAIAGGIKRPTRKLRTGRSDSASLFGLAPCGVLPATRVATGAVRSYRTFSPLLAFARPTPLTRAPAQQAPDPLVEPAAPKSGKRSQTDEGGRYIFCATFLRVTPTGRYPAHCPAEFGLSSRLRALQALRRSKLASRSVRLGALPRRTARSAPGLPHRIVRSAPGLPRRSARSARRRAIICSTAAVQSTRLKAQGSRLKNLNIALSHQPPVRFRIAPVSCTDCCAACRSLRPSLRCSNCSRGVCRRGTSAQRTP
jgi:hypothetical protein